jgi:hypothetical protein
MSGAVDRCSLIAGMRVSAVSYGPSRNKIRRTVMRVGVHGLRQRSPTMPVEQIRLYRRHSSHSAPRKIMPSGWHGRLSLRLTPNQMRMKGRVAAVCQRRRSCSLNPIHDIHVFDQRQQVLESIQSNCADRVASERNLNLQRTRNSRCLLTTCPCTPLAARHS